MKFGNIELKLCSDSSVIKKLQEEYLSDPIDRQNFSNNYLEFTNEINSTWNAEYYTISYLNIICGYIHIEHNRYQRFFSFSIIIDKKYRNKAIGMITSAYILWYMFCVMGYKKFNSAAFSYNKNSVNIQKRLLTYEGCRRQSIYAFGKYYDKLLFGLTDEEFSAMLIKYYRIFHKFEELNSLKSLIKI